MEHIFSLEPLDEEILKEPNGYWRLIGNVVYPDRIITHEPTGYEAAKLTQRAGSIKAWMNDGVPQFYIANYGHKITSIASSTNHLPINIEWKDAAGVTIKSEMISETIICGDSNRHKVWGFTITPFEVHNAKSSTAEPFGLSVDWKQCV